MLKQNLNALIDFNESKFNLNVLIKEPGYRMVLLSLRAGQSVPEHAAPGKVTVYTMRGHVTFFEGEASCDLQAGEVVSLVAGARHRVDAHEDSVLLVLDTGVAETGKVTDGDTDRLRHGDAPGPSVNRAEDSAEELDLREVPRSERHPLIFRRFDALAEGASMRLLNDHDPVPLNRQLESLRAGQASWEYIERGPTLFRIRIQRIGARSLPDVPLKTASQQVQIESHECGGCGH